MSRFCGKTQPDTGWCNVDGQRLTESWGSDSNLQWWKLSQRHEKVVWSSRTKAPLRWNVGNILMCRVMEGMVDDDGQFKLNSLRRTEQWKLASVSVMWSSSQAAALRTDWRRQSTLPGRTAVVESWQHVWNDHWLNNWEWNWALNAAKLSKDSKAACDSTLNVRITH